MTFGVTHLTVRRGSTVALRDVDLDVPDGEVTAVVGGDGAGKSTLLAVLAGVPLDATGEVRRPERVGYSPSGSGVIRDLTVTENLEFVAAAYRMGDLDRRARELLERTGLAPFRDRLAGDLSGGMRQKLGFLMAILHEPPLVVLDEPTTGVDPVSRVELWRLVAAAAADGRAVLVSSTYLDEAERAARVLLLREGQALASGTPEEIVAALPGSIVETDHPTNRQRSWRRGTRWREWHPEGSPEAAAPDLEDAAIVAELAGGGS